jgi:hypothetical protein
MADLLLRMTSFLCAELEIRGITPLLGNQPG